MKIYFAGSIRGGRDDWFIYKQIIAEVTRPSLGVGYEIGKASEWGKQVLCFYRPAVTKDLSAMIGGCPEATVYPYETIEDVRRLLAQHLGSK